MIKLIYRTRCQPGLSSTHMTGDQASVVALLGPWDYCQAVGLYVPKNKSEFILPPNVNERGIGRFAVAKGSFKRS